MIKSPRFFYVLVAVKLILLQGLAYASEMSLEQIQKKAIENSAFLQAQARESDSEKILSEGAALLPNPYFVLQGGKEESAPYVGSTWDVTLSQLFPFPGKLSSQKRLQRIQADLSVATEEEAKLMVQHEVTLAAARVLMFSEIAKHSQERRRRFRLIQDFIRTHPQVSPAQKVEAALIENQIRLLEKGILETHRDKQIAELELNLYLRMPTPPEPHLQWIQKPKAISKTDLEARLFEKNWQIVKSTRLVERASEQLHRASLDPLPDINFALNYRKENVVPINYFYSAAIGFTLPLWDHGQYLRPALRANLEKEQLRQDYLKQKLKNSFETAFIRLETSLETLKLFPMSLISFSEQKFSEAETQLKKGRVSISAFLQTDAQIHETLDSIYQAQLAYLASLSEVLLLVGHPIDF